MENGQLQIWLIEKLSQTIPFRFVYHCIIKNYTLYWKEKLKNKKDKLNLKINLLDSVDVRVIVENNNWEKYKNFDENLIFLCGYE